METVGDSWCDQVDLEIFKGLVEVETRSEWFRVFEVGENVYAIAEPFNYEEVISYLIVGKNKALLFDTGMGLTSISNLVKDLTNLPIIVLNSHTHYDHIGGNYEFDTIIALNNEYTLYWAKNGWDHDLVKNEVSADAICLHLLPDLDTAKYFIRPFEISSFISGGHIIDLGERIIEVITVPGHAPDAIALLDRSNGYLWTGDTFYEAAIWLYFDGTDLDAYRESVSKLEALSPNLKWVFPAHNRPVVKPARLAELVNSFDQILTGKVKAKGSDANELPVYDSTQKLEFEFEHFSFIIRSDYLELKGVTN